MTDIGEEILNSIQQLPCIWTNMIRLTKISIRVLIVVEETEATKSAKTEAGF